MVKLNSCQFLILKRCSILTIEDIREPNLLEQYLPLLLFSFTVDITDIEAIDISIELKFPCIISKF